MTELGTFLLPAMPLLALLLALLFGHYPGRETIVRLSERIAAWRHFWDEAPSRRFAPRRAPFTVPAGGRLLASSLSGRAPPAVA